MLKYIYTHYNTNCEAIEVLAFTHDRSVTHELYQPRVLPPVHRITPVVAHYVQGIAIYIDLS